MEGQERTRKRRMVGAEVNVYNSNTQKFDAGGSIFCYVCNKTMRERESTRVSQIQTHYQAEWSFP